MSFFARMLGRRRPIAAAPPLARPKAEDPQADLAEIFTPTRPQRSARRVAGRQAELQRLVRAITRDHAHVVLYGERGQGKTSLINVFAASARSSGYMVGRYTCAFDSTFEDILRGMARDLPASVLAVPGDGRAGLEGCEAALPPDRLQPRDLITLPGRLSGRHLILIADEFDRVEDDRTRTLFADSIKQASDRGAPLSLVIVGVSDSLDELLGRHPSIQRNVLAIPLPLLTDGEVDGIVLAGGRDAGLEFEPAVRAGIAFMARGMPYIAQLLGLHAGTAAAERRSAAVTLDDLAVAAARALAEADPRVSALYGRLTRDGADRDLAAALQSIAGGEHDASGRFKAMSTGGTAHVAGRSVAPTIWTRLVEAGAVRACPSIGPEMFTFADPMLPHHVLIRAWAARHGSPRADTAKPGVPDF